jgi:hypothetical protein
MLLLVAKKLLPLQWFEWMNTKWIERMNTKD